MPDGEAVKPLAIDLYCGLGGWTEGLLAENFRVVGFDIERHVYGEHCYPAQLVLQDVTTLCGWQFKDAALIVASPPCQEYSYMAMPWSRAKAIAAEYRSGRRDVKRLTALFDACFRIQREAIEAAGHFIPLVVENVRGAQPWVGRSRWNYGSYHLWGDVPALMPMTKAVLKGGWMSQADGAPMRRDDGGKGTKPYPNPGWTQGCAIALGLENYNGQKVPGFRFDGSGRSMQSESVDRHIKNNGGSWFGSYQAMKDGLKQGGDWFNADQPSISGMCSSKSSARKAASAMIARIPFPLAKHIARTWKPQP